MHYLNLRDPVSAWSHAVWLAATLPGARMLWNRAAGDRGRQIILLAYVLCLASCASASTLYHGVTLPGDQLSVLLRLDHIGIYLLIAGTYTPIAWVLLKGRWKQGTLAAIWLVAAFGIGFNVFLGHLPRHLETALYLLMGWGSVFCYLELSRTFPSRTLRPMPLGGVIYSVGVVFHVLQWPVLWPGVFGGHEVFHFLVVAASATHFRFMLEVVAPWGLDLGPATPALARRPLLADPPQIPDGPHARPEAVVIRR